MSEKKIETKTIKTAEASNSELTGKIELPEIKQYPVVPAPAPQVPPAEVGVASPLKSLVEKEGRTVITPSGYTSPFVHGDPIAENEPVDSPFVGFNGSTSFGLQGLISNADKVSLDKFLDFKTEVIKAFRHLGLDTRRHFTE